ncbi:MAG: tetratricopeptide repeat protein, partial [Pseudanabaenaceae cyanobacterium]
VGRGNTKSALGDNQGAIADYDQALRLQPDLAEAYNNRGIVKSALGDKRGAISDLREGARLFQQQGDTAKYEEVRDLIRRLGG